MYNSQQRFKESNDSLTSFNEFSSTMYNNLSGEYEKHTKALKEMKKDLDHVFKRIRYFLLFDNIQYHLY